MLIEIWKGIVRGKTFNRSVMNISLSDYSLEDGLVLDIGGGKVPSYFDFIKRNPNSSIINFDKQHSNKNIDFEKDKIPYSDNTVDQILMFNVLEHIYEHNFLVREVFRVLKRGGQVIGYVPFMINYHADPNDYFRYTHEALGKIFESAGFSGINIKPLGLGPFSVNFNNLASFMPRLINSLIWPVYFILDRILIFARPEFRSRFPIGYLFVLRK